MHSWIVHVWEVFDWWIGALVERLVEYLKQGVVLDWACGPACGALKTKICSTLDSLIVHVWEVFDSWIVPAWSLKQIFFFRIVLA